MFIYLLKNFASLFKLAQGEYIAPERIENIICRNQYIAQAYVEGDSLESSIVAIVVPDRETLTPWAKLNGLLPKDGQTSLDFFADLCKDPKVKTMLQKEITNLGSAGTKELKGFEIPRDIHVESEEFSIANGLLTPTFKLRREAGKKHYAAKISQMYQNIKSDSPNNE